LAKFLQVDEGFQVDTSVSHNTRRNDKPGDKVLFSRENFNRIIQPIKQDVAAMEDFLGRSLDNWDLSEERWCTTIKAASAPKTTAS